MATIINVRLEGPTESDVRKAAELMGVQVSTVKARSGSLCHLYGAMTLPEPHRQTVTVRTVSRPALPR